MNNSKLADMALDGAMQENGQQEMFRKEGTQRKISGSGQKIIDKPTYNKITKPVIRRGADIDAVDLSAARKDALRHAAGYMEGELYKAPWH